MIIRINPPFPFNFEDGPKRWINSLGYTFKSWERVSKDAPVYIDIVESIVDTTALELALTEEKPYRVIDAKLEEAITLDKAARLVAK